MSNENVPVDFTAALRALLRTDPDQIYCARLGGPMSAAEHKKRLATGQGKR